MNTKFSFVREKESGYIKVNKKNDMNKIKLYSIVEVISESDICLF